MNLNIANPLVTNTTLENEEALLGSVLINAECFPDVRIVEAADFYVHKNRWLWDAFCVLHDNGSAIDLLTVSDELDRRNQLAEVGGMAYLARLLNAVPTSMHAEHYARILKRDSTRRRLMDAASAIAKLATDTERHVADLIADAIATVNAVQDGTSARVFTQSEAVSAFYDGMADYIRNGKIIGVTTGYKKLDAVTLGFKRGELTVLAGRPSMGKTSLAAQMSVRQARAGHRVAVFTLEESKRAWIEAAALSELGMDKMKATDNDFGTLTRKCAELERLPMCYYEHGTSTLADIEKHLRAMHNTLGGVDVIWLDHLAYMKHPQVKGMTVSYAIGQTTKGLAKLSKEYNAACITLAQLSRESARTGAPPQLTDLRESGEIEQDARAVYFIHTPGYYQDPPPPDEVPQETQIRIAKNHDGPTGKVNMAFVKNCRRFAEWENHEPAAR